MRMVAFPFLEPKAPHGSTGTATTSSRAELQAMADRWTVVDCLKRGLPYRGIHRLTGVSVTTIGRVARFLAAGHGGYDTAARRLAQTRSAQARRGAGASTGSTAGVGKRAPRRMEAVRHE